MKLEGWIAVWGVVSSVGLLACSSSSGTNGADAGSDAASTANDSGATTNGDSGATADSGGGGASCALATVTGTCSTTPLGDGSYECVEDKTDLSSSCAAASMTWKAGATCASGALYCCKQSNGFVIDCYYGALTDWGGTLASAQSACEQSGGTWCPR